MAYYCKLLVLVIRLSLFTHQNGWRLSCEVKPSKTIPIVIQLNCFLWFIYLFAYICLNTVKYCKILSVDLFVLVCMLMQFSDFVITDLVSAHCLIMVIVFSLYFKGYERLAGCVYESVCMWVNYLGFSSV